MATLPPDTSIAVHLVTGVSVGLQQYVPGNVLKFKERYSLVGQWEIGSFQALSGMPSDDDTPGETNVPCQLDPPFPPSPPSPPMPSPPPFSPPPSPPVPPCGGIGESDEVVLSEVRMRSRLHIMRELLCY